MTRDSSPTLVGLPHDIRRRIYLHIGVARFDGIPYTYFLDGRRGPSPKPPRQPRNRSEAFMMHIVATSSSSDFNHPPTRNFTGLLRTCRALYVEAAALLYSANHFVIFYSQPVSFKYLCGLSPRSLASLTSLKIVLNQSCHERTSPNLARSMSSNCRCDYHEIDFWAAKHHCAKKRGGQHRSPLLDPAEASNSAVLPSAKQEVQVMMDEWCDAAASITPHIPIGRLELSLVCDINSEHPYASEAARLALAPINLFPRLRDCHVRLCKLPSYPVQQMAQETALQACGRAFPVRLGPANAKSSSALTSLPPELRIRILEYTDLITPWKEVTWSRQHRGYQVIFSLCSSSSVKCPPQNHNGCRLSNCDPNLIDVGQPYVPQPGFCFCRRQHAAFSSTCNCWTPPTNLFLICRTLHRDAQFVFFSQNRFIVHDFHARQPWSLPSVQHAPVPPDTASTSTLEYYPFERLAISEFVRDIVPAHCLSYLRFLELVFPPYVPHGWPRREHPALLDWAAAVDWLRGQINAPALTLRVVMADFWADDMITSRTTVTKALVDDVIGGYADITRPLRALARGEDSLRGFYVHVAHPARWTRGIAHRASYEGDGEDGFLARMHRKLDAQVERYVLGSESRLGGDSRAEPSKSTWQRWYEMDPHGD